MRNGDASCGVVVLAALDVRPRPEHRAELVSQLLLGETVRVLASPRGGEWLRVRNDADGYAGWVRSWGLRRASPARIRRWRGLAGGRVVVSFGEVRADPRGGHLLTPVFWNARLIAGRRRGSVRRVELPDGRRGWIHARAVASRSRPTPLIGRIRSLLGTPYLWGGRTPHGFDCSGFVQQLVWEQGLALPRDAHDQFRLTRRGLEPGDLKPGDLVFFGRPGARIGHVGMALGGGYYVHCRGWVRVNSLERGNRFCDNELIDQIRGFGRPGLAVLARG